MVTHPPIEVRAEGFVNQDTLNRDADLANVTEAADRQAGDGKIPIGYGWDGLEDRLFSNCFKEK